MTIKTVTKVAGGISFRLEEWIPVKGTLHYKTRTESARYSLSNASSNLLAVDQSTQCIFHISSHSNKSCLKYLAASKKETQQCCLSTQQNGYRRPKDKKAITPATIHFRLLCKYYQLHRTVRESSAKLIVPRIDRAQSGNWKTSTLRWHERLLFSLLWAPFPLDTPTNIWCPRLEMAKALFIDKVPYRPTIRKDHRKSENYKYFERR